MNFLIGVLSLILSLCDFKSLYRSGDIFDFYKVVKLVLYELGMRMCVYNGRFIRSICS